jgi:hypothetical protein
VIVKIAAFVLSIATVFEIESAVNPAFKRHVEVSATAFLDYFDRRPAKPVLLVGDNHILVNDLPSLVRLIADSDAQTERWSLTVKAVAGGSMQDFWKSDDIHESLTHPWTELVLLGQSGASTPESRASFEAYGEKLIGMAKTTGTPVALVVNWGLPPHFFSERNPEAAKEALEAYSEELEQDHRKLAAWSGANLIDANGTFRELRAEAKAPGVTTDGDHPTLFGSYVTALAIYRQMTGHPLRANLWAPPGIDRNAANIAADTVERVEAANATGMAALK